MAAIFVSYRRSDSSGYAGRLVDSLEEQFPGHQLFRDVESIEAGSDFVDAIARALNASSALIVVIGPRWLEAADAAGRRRLDDPQDFVRLEISTALQSGLKLIPVLVDGAQMPAAEKLPEDIRLLARKQGLELSDRRWDYDVGLLFDQLARVPGIQRRLDAVPEPARVTPLPVVERKSSGTFWKVAGGAVAAVVTLSLFGAFSGGDPAPVPAPLPVVSETPASAPAAAPVTAPEARVPVAAVPVSYEPARSAAPADRNVASPTPAPARAATPNVTGLWRSPEGDGLYFEQHGREVAVIAGDASATQGFIGKGAFQGRRLDLALTHLQTGAAVHMQLALSDDGRQMAGSGQVAGVPSEERIVLVRQ